ncbi:alpha/beta hydrolase fold domain-containing protein [Phenylobacterium sp. LjRoot219]|uniref:alpha/beta hydrolase fold domain-containing protein n=1 Tax=Phenylobacterium sp. LjRoot219 TaxID=3342283 RepID=UPI003ECF6CB8
MAYSDARMFVPARTLPVPTTISPQAQAVLAQGSPYGHAEEPDPRDKAAWAQRVEERNAMLTEMIEARFAAQREAFTFAAQPLSAATLHVVTPKELRPGDERRAVLYVHGGGFTMGGGIAAAYAAAGIAGLAKLRTFSVDYRMPPQSPFPAGLDDAVEAYRVLLDRYAPEHIAVYGASAGGGLAASCLLKARDLGLPMPGACVLRSPEADLTESGDSFETNNGVDPVLGRLTNSIALYADGHDLTDPYLSPLYGDFNKGFPPTLLTSGTRDLFLSNTVLMHRALRRAGIVADLQIWEAMGHAGFLGAAPEDHEMFAEEVEFIRQRLASR